METNWPCSTVSDTSRKTCRVPDEVVNDFDSPLTSMNAISAAASHRSQPGFGEPHQPVEGEADDADGDDRQEDVRVHEAVVLLPEEPADAGRAGEHLAG